MMRYVRYVIILNSSSIYATETNYFYLLFKEARLKYILLLLANFIFSIYFHYYLSRPSNFNFHFGINISSISIVLHFIPLFSDSFKMLIRIMIFLQTFALLFPILLASSKLKQKLHDDSQTIIYSIFLFTLTLFSVLLVGLFDAIVSIIFSWTFSIFYYFAWVFALLAESICLFRFVLKDWDQTYRDISRQKLFISLSASHKDQILVDTLSPISKYIWVKCPKCQESTLYPISTSTRKIIKSNPSGIS